MQEIKTFRADSMHAALNLVRQELGPDALILHTRQVPRKSRLPWQRDKLETEILAVAEETPAVSHPREAAGTAPTEKTSVAATKPPQTQPVKSLPYSAEFTTDSSVKFPTEQPAPITKPTVSRLPTRFTDADFQTPPTQSTPAPVPPPAVKIKPEIPVAPRESERLEQLVNERLNSLQQMVEQLSRQVQSTAAPQIPVELSQEYAQLIEAEVDEQYARDLVQRLSRQLTAQERQQPATIQQRLLSLLTAEIRCCGPVRLQPGQQKIVALVGPTGVGKTTTIAKLAANFRLRDQVRLGLITVDTYRIAAVDQLRTYADILDLPMKVVTSPDEMRQAVQELSAMDLILIDTAGRSPQDEPRISELKTFLGQIVVDEIHLVLSATTGNKQQKQIVEKFQSVQPTACILTKLDEAAGAGSIANISGQIGLPLSYLTIGQSVPKDIEPAQRSRSVRLILGNENIRTKGF